MLLTKLPLELVHEIIAVAVISEDTPSGALRLREVNHLFDDEATKGFIRDRNHDQYPKSTWAKCPYSFRVRWVRDLIIGPRRKANAEIAAYWTKVVDHLENTAKMADPENSGLITRQQWFNESCEVIALQEADCQCGKPAFYHLARYDQQIKETAFHVAFLKGHTELEKAMIRDGMSYRSDCPYIQVHLHDARRQRKNALQWAIQAGCTGTAMRLLEAMTDEQRCLGDWDAAIQIAASRNNMELVDYFLSTVFDVSPTNSRGITDESLAQATLEASEYGYWDIFLKIYDKRPHQLDYTVIGNAAEANQWEILERFLQMSEFVTEGTLRTYFNKALSGASRRGHFEIYQKILDRWAKERNKPISKLRVRDFSNDIAEGGNTEILQLHVEHGLLLRPLEVLGEASYQGHLKMVECIWDGELKKFQESAEDFDIKEFLDVFRACLIWAVRQNHVDTVRWLLQRIGTGVLSDCTKSIWEPENPIGMNLLAMAIDIGSKEMMEFLLKTRRQLETEFLETDFQLWQIDNLDFSSLGREARKNEVEDYVMSMRLNATSLAYKRYTMAPQWVVEDTLKRLIIFNELDS